MFNKFFFILPVLLCSCGYKQGAGGHDSTCSICVPYIEGDRDGLFTSELIYSLKASGLFSESKKALTMKVKICDNIDQEIGWRQDFKVLKNEKRVIVDEKRKILVLEVTLCRNGKVCWGPRKIRSYVDYDFFDPDSLNDLSFQTTEKRKETLSFSMGQLSAEDDALFSSKTLLYRKLSQKIVDQISLEW